MKRSLIFTHVPTVMLLMIAAGQAGADQQQVLIDIQHDSRRQVTCWVTPQGGISCLPDSSLLQVPASTSTDESAAARASLANSGGETGRLPATPLPQEERFQL
ncbi:hypothetical protein [Pseudomonas sp. 11/12A]|uniref:hypothetical protein n=1 Tax=Pseudomonas sp. 11/12A TaxID=1506582 RepID=UPI0006458EBB|nr:hypothetical protein [Pseudomonas sp. 11/12A]